MAIKIRLKRMGNRHRPFFRLVVADSRSPRDGRFVEQLGYYDPLKAKDTYVVNEERTLYWLGEGAGLSETARSLLKQAGVLAKFRAKREGARRAGVQPAAAGAAEVAAERTVEEIIAAEAEAVRAARGAEREDAPAETAAPRESDETSPAGAS